MTPADRVTRLSVNDRITKLRVSGLRTLDDVELDLVGLTVLGRRRRVGQEQRRQRVLNDVFSRVHYEVMGIAWSWVPRLAAKEDVQVFAATNRRNVVKGLAEVAADSDVAVYRLEHHPGGHRVVRFSLQDLVVASQRDIEIT